MYANLEQVVVGYDGANSVIASWMGIEKTVAIGTVVIRGLAIFPDGHKFEDKVYYYVGKGSRSAILPSTSTKVYWFFVWNDSSEGKHVYLLDDFLWFWFTFFEKLVVKRERNRNRSSTKVLLQSCNED